MAPLRAAVLAVLCSDASALRRAKASGKVWEASTKLAGVSVYYAEKQAVKDQWMVSFGEKGTDAMVEAFCAQTDCIAKGHPDEGGFAYAVVKGSEKKLETSLAAHAAGVELVEQDAIAEDFEEESPASASWGLGAIGVPQSRSKGQGVNVYVLDSGVRVSHKDFGGRAIPFYDATFSPAKVCDFGDTKCANDARGHGSHVAGSVGGASYGVAPGSTIFAMQRGRSMSDGFGCIDWLAQNRKRPAVLQMSWGVGSPSSVGKAAVDAVVAAGITVTVASGNSNEDACKWTFGGVPSAISVASTDRRMRRSSFSNYGPCIDILAPGSDIVSTDYRSDEGTSTKSGTSMAAPHVAGACALILEANPEFSPEQVLTQLKANSAKMVIADAKSDNYFLNVGPPVPPGTAPPAPTPGPPTPAPPPSCPWYCQGRLCVLGACKERCDFCKEG